MSDAASDAASDAPSGAERRSYGPADFDLFLRTRFVDPRARPGSGHLSPRTSVRTVLAERVYASDGLTATEFYGGDSPRWVRS